MEAREARHELLLPCRSEAVSEDARRRRGSALLLLRPGENKIDHGKHDLPPVTGELRIDDATNAVVRKRRIGLGLTGQRTATVTPGSAELQNAVGNPRRGTHALVHVHDRPQKPTTMDRTTTPETEAATLEKLLVDWLTSYHVIVDAPDKVRIRRGPSTAPDFPYTQNVPRRVRTEKGLGHASPEKNREHSSPLHGAVPVEGAGGTSGPSGIASTGSLVVTSLDRDGGSRVTIPGARV